MKPTIESPPLYLATSATGPASVTEAEKQTRTILATLEQCHEGLTRSGNRGSAKLLSITILDLRMKLNHVTDSELNDLCDAINDPPKKQARRGSLLRLVK